MNDFGEDQRAAEAEPIDGAPLTPAIMAERVAELVGEDAGLRGGHLPMWDRLDARRSGSESRRAQFWSTGLWGATLVMLAIAALRVLWHDGAMPLIWLNAFTRYVYLPSYPIFAVAAWQRRWPLAMANAAVIACHLVWVAPDFYPATPFEFLSGSGSAAPSIRIFYANVHGSNQSYDEMLADAMQADADVIVFVELQRPWFQKLKESPALKAYPYGTSLRKRHMGDVNVFSRLPINRQQIITSQERVSNVVDIRLGDEVLRVFALHGPRPNVDGRNDYTKFWRKIEPILAEQSGPLVVIGDFNATQHSRVYERLTSGRLRSAHEDRGRGYATTWPNGRLPLPPIRIDQAFLSPEVECVSIVEGKGAGSDHKSLVLDVRVHASAETPAPAL
jgi:endonuclease/exonuclease/phosphatase (EEP) superfamily protein YafD